MSEEQVSGQTTVSVATYETGDQTAKTSPAVSREEREPRLLPPYRSKVMVALGMTKSLGEFEFARVDVSIEDFCQPTPEERRKLFDELRLEAREMVKTIIVGIKGRG